MKTLRQIVISTPVLLLVLTIIGCTSPPAFKGGIRVVSTEAIEGISNSSFPVTNVLDYGNAANGGDNNGQQSFEVVTGAFGIDDHLGVALATNWTVTVNYVAVMPACGQASYAAFVPDSGAVFTGVCYTIVVG
jgi:hypothetical protein